MKNEEVQKINLNFYFYKPKYKNNKNKSIELESKYSLIIIIILLILIYFFILGKISSEQMAPKSNIHPINKSSTIFITKDEEFNESLRQNYLFEQKYFCENQVKLNNSIIENQIKIVKCHLDNMVFDIFIYKKNDILSNEISITGGWETQSTMSIISSLLFYSSKKNIEKKDIYVLDIGANIGWYSIVLGKKGYNVLSFEPSKINYYILLKNFCVNNDINMIIINKGLDKEEKKCILYHPLNNIGNAMLSNNTISNFMKEEIILTKLNNYIQYLNTKHLALIKLDIEGSEGKAIEGGLELITKYHIPFIMMELNPKSFRRKGTDPRLILEIFENNGYKISTKDFLSKEYTSIDILLKEKLVNVYIVYIKFLE